MCRRCRTLFLASLLFHLATLCFSTLLYNGVRLSSIPNPDFRTSFVLRSNNGSDSFKEVYTGQNQMPFYVRVYAKVSSGVNSGFCFEGVGAAQVSARKSGHSYGGLIYAYNSNFVRIWAPSKFRKISANGRIIFIGHGWGGEKYSQEAEEAVVFVEIWNIGPIPTFQTKVLVDTRLPNRVFFEVEHKLDEIPERVMVRVTPLSVDSKKPSANHGFWFNAMSSSQNMWKKGYGGVIFAYNVKKIKLWLPSSWTKRTGCVFVQNGWGGEVNGENTPKCLVYIFAWVLGLSVPSYTTDWKSLTSQGWENSFLEIKHNLNVLPSMVIVQGRTGSKGLIFEASGAVMSTDKSPKGYGGIIYAYDKNSMRIWLPQRTNGTKNGYSIFVNDGWGDGRQVIKSHLVKLRVRIYTSTCASTQEAVTEMGFCKAFKYNSYQWQTGPWMKCSNICNQGHSGRRITGCDISTSETVDEAGCDFARDLCMWQAFPPSSWRRVKDHHLPSENFTWNYPKDSYHALATSNNSENAVILASPKFAPRESCSLSFKYKMFGNPPAILKLEASVEENSAEPAGWSMQNDQGGAFWRQGYVKLTRFRRLNQLFFVFLLDHKSENNRSPSYGNVSVDDVKLECDSVGRKRVGAEVCKERKIPSAGCVHPASEPATRGPAYRPITVNRQDYVIARGRRGDPIASYDFLIHVAGEYSIWLHAFGTSTSDNGVRFKIDNLDYYGWHTTYVDKASRPLWIQYVYETFTLMPGVHTVYLSQLEANFKFSHLTLTPKRLLTWIPLGMQSRYIPDSSLSAYPVASGPAPKFGRLNGEDAWCSSDHNPGYVRMEITLPELAVISRIAVQGGEQIKRKTNSYWVTEFKMKVSMDGIHFSWYRASLGKRMFPGNTDASGIVEHELPFAVVAKKILIFPFNWQNWVCMRVELYGVYMPENMCTVAGLQPPTMKDCEGDRNCSTNADCKPISKDSIIKTGLPDSLEGLEACHCHSGYHGDSCQHVGCTPNPCQNGGTCHSRSYNFTCSCLIGYYGPLCQHPCPVGKYGKDCAQTCVCGNHGTCNVATGHCSCEPGYYGRTCDEVCPQGYFGDDCKQRCGCKNGADCDYVSGACNCTAGWTAVYCDQPCSSNAWGPQCHNQCKCSGKALSCDPVSGQCICKPGFTGATCDQPCPADKYGSYCTGTCQCSRQGTCDPVSGLCTCHEPGWTGIRCNRPCPKGFFGDNCGHRCTCRDNAECNATSGDCECASGFYGPRCDLPCSDRTWGPGCKSTCQCSNNGTCDSVTGACLCLAGWHGARCDSKCVDGKWGKFCENPCDCRNNASCEPLTGICQCQPGWNGSKCDVSCQTGFYGPRCENRCRCAHGESCEPLTGDCLCPPGWLGRTCVEACPAGRFGNGCSHTCSCRNGADCDHVSGACTCAAGWTGADCSKPCPPGFFGSNCSRSCQCSADHTRYCEHVSGHCHCKPGYAGPRCSQTCPPGYYGKHCSQRCQCQNGGECQPVDGRCLCLAGYYGDRCEHTCPAMRYGINCSERCSACVHSQVSACSPVTGKCLCAAGYYGYHCENRCPEGEYGLGCKRKCDCRNGAHCNHVNGSCECAKGFTGTKCEKLCPEGTFGHRCRGVCLCNNGGLCDKVSGQCSCLAGYVGTQCIEECPERRWGIECRNKCSCAWNHTVKCRGDTGACQCRAGYRGATCEKFCDDGTYGQDCKHPCPKCSRHVTGICYKVDGRCPCSPGYRGQLCDNDCLLKNYGKGCRKRCRCERHQVCYHVDGTCHALSSGQFKIMIRENYIEIEEAERRKQLKLHLAGVVTENYDRYSEILHQLSKRQIPSQSPDEALNSTVITRPSSSYYVPYTATTNPGSSNSHDIVTRIIKWSKAKSSDGQHEVIIFTLVMFNGREMLNGSIVKDVIESIDEDVLSEMIGSVYYSGALYSETSAKPSMYVQLITSIVGGFLLLVILAVIFTKCKRRHQQLKAIKTQKKREKEAETEMEMRTRHFRHHGYRLAFDNPYYDVLAAMALDDDIEEDYINPLCDLESLMSHQGSDATVSSATECSIHKGESLQSVSYC